MFLFFPFFLLAVCIIQRLIHDLFLISSGIIPRPPCQPETQSRADMGRGMVAGMIWKRSCINLLIIYFRQIAFFGANKQNQIIKCIWKFNCVLNRYIFRTLLSNKIISTLININNNISFRDILKLTKYRKHTLMSCFIYREL